MAQGQGLRDTHLASWNPNVELTIAFVHGGTNNEQCTAIHQYTRGGCTVGSVSGCNVCFALQWVR
jgi:hypothetical protein